MNAIVAVDNNWAIGCKNSLLVRIPADHKNFRQETTGKVVVLGRKTLETFPQGMPLPNRTNIILSANPDYKVKDAVVVHDKEELDAELKKYPTEDVTKIDHDYEADAYFPNLDQDGAWEITAESEEQTYFDLPYYFVKYERKKQI